MEGVDGKGVVGAVNLRDKGTAVDLGVRGLALLTACQSLPLPGPGLGVRVPSWAPAVHTRSPTVAGQNVPSLGAAKNTLY